MIIKILNQNKWSITQFILKCINSITLPRRHLVNKYSIVQRIEDLFTMTEIYIEKEKLNNVIPEITKKHSQFPMNQKRMMKLNSLFQKSLIHVVAAVEVSAR